MVLPTFAGKNSMCTVYRVTMQVLPGYYRSNATTVRRGALRTPPVLVKKTARQLRDECIETPRRVACPSGFGGSRLVGTRSREAGTPSESDALESRA